MSLEKIEELQNTPTNQTFQVSKTSHRCHPNAGNESIYIEHSTCIGPYHSCRGTISFENLDAAKKSLKILIKQLDHLKTKDIDDPHKFIITPECKLHSAERICF